jgi:magnesium-transporting ATPase (P-type)
MLKRIFHALASSWRDLLRNWIALIVMLALYLAMLGAIYLFFGTREATVGQLLLSFLLAIAAPVLFLIIQTMAARYRDESGHVGRLLGTSARDFWKLLVIVVPLILIAVLAVYIFGKIEPGSPAATVREAARAAATPPRPAAPKPQPVHWRTVAITTVEYLLFCLVLPLAAIHLWIATARDGVKQTLKRSARILARAFAPQAVLTYAIGFIFFAVVPYFLIVTKTPATSAWLDVGLLVVRLALAVLFSLIGWAVTVGALGELSEGSSTVSVAQASEGTGHVPAEA